MNATILLLFAACPICKATDKNHYGLEYPQLLRPAQASSCRVNCSDGSGGSGVLMQMDNGQPIVLTAAHVVSPRSRASCVFPGGETISGRVLAARRDSDAALIALDSPPKSTPGVLLARDPVKPGEHVYCFGYGTNMKPRWQVGIRCDTNLANSNWMEVSGEARSGDSGGPMFVVRNKRVQLVGCLWGTGISRQAPRHRIIGSRLRVIQAFFPSLQQRKQTHATITQKPGPSSGAMLVPGDSNSLGPGLPQLRAPT